MRFIEGGPELPSPVEKKTLASWTEFGGEDIKRFSGTARYTTTFDKPSVSAGGWLLDLGRVCDSARVRVNGKEVGTLIKAPFHVRIPRELMKEKNTLEVDVSNLMANRIAYLDRQNVIWKKFYNTNFPARKPENRGADGLFTASRWQPRDSGLIGPVTISPIESLKLER